MARRLRGLLDDQGFTLVELLIVVTILGILAAVVTISLVGVTSTAKTNSCAEELRIVQAGVDSLMAKNTLTTVTAQAAATTDMTIVVAAGEALSPNYVRQAVSKGAYTWTAAGAVSAVAGAPGSC